jgi:flagellar operon protein
MDATRIGEAARMPAAPAAGTGSSRSAGPSFAEVLQREVARVRFSAHAARRLEERRISLGEADLARLSRAVEMAAAKGCREALVLMDHLALVTNVRNRTVVTAMPAADWQNHVFTNIDGAVIVR